MARCWRQPPASARLTSASRGLILRMGGEETPAGYCGAEVVAILEVSDDGMLRVPGEMLPGGRPHSQFELEQVGNVTLLRPAGAAGSAQQGGTPAERAAAFQRWVESPHPAAPDLPAECLRRESLYD